MGIRLRVSDGITSDSTTQVVTAQMARILSDDPSIDGIICSSTASTMASVAALEICGHRLGQDIDVFAKEALPFLNLFRKEIMALHEDVKEAGEFLARAAIQAIKEPHLPPLQGLQVPNDED